MLPHEKEIKEYLQTIERLKKQSAGSPLFTKEIAKLESKLEQLKREIYSSLTPWQRVQISRHPQRPHAIDTIAALFTEFNELSGDRLFGDDGALVGGLARFQGEPCVVIGQEKGSTTEERLKHNFGMMSPEGYRKALRLMRLAEKFRLPVISFVDTPGAYPGLEAEERGQGWAIAENLREMAILKTPIVVVILGEGCSGGALGVGVGDTVAMLEHSYYSVISPEGCASILWKEPSRSEGAASMLKLNAEHLLEYGIIDSIIPEPLGGAHHNREATYTAIRQFISEKLGELKHLSHELLLEARYRRLRSMGRFDVQPH